MEVEGGEGGRVEEEEEGRDTHLPVSREEERGGGKVQRESLADTPPHDRLGLGMKEHSLQSQLQPRHVEHTQSCTHTNDIM